MQVLGQMLKSLKALHDEGFAHRNLKPSNILHRKSHNDWVLADFACAAILSASPSHARAIALNCRGTHLENRIKML